VSLHSRALPSGYLVRITGRLVLDCMGNQSPISRQLRWGKRPDGICIVVGSCASGFAPENNTMVSQRARALHPCIHKKRPLWRLYLARLPIVCSLLSAIPTMRPLSNITGFACLVQSDLIYSMTPITDKGGSAVQYFWEAFPASSGPGDR
jgi:hypothetical protein